MAPSTSRCGGGWTPTSWDDGTLAPAEEVGWEETWFVIAGIGGLSTASDSGALRVARSAEQLDVVVTSKERATWRLVVSSGVQEVARQEIVVSPETPFRSGVLPLPALSVDAQLTVSVEGPGGPLLVAHVE